MKRKSLLILILILISSISFFIFLISQALVPYGEYCTGSVAPEYQKSCEVKIFGLKLYNPILGCKPLKPYYDGGSGTCEYRFGN